MPRAPRIEFAGAIYHLMNRGDHLESIFEDDKDREVFLKTLEETCVSSGWQAHSFVLMGNHYHLLIETTRPTLVKGMQYLNSTYTARYNARHKTRGHLFQGRYKALLVDGEAGGYFLTVSDYIHLNPARMKGKGQISNVTKGSVLWIIGNKKTTLSCDCGIGRSNTTASWHKDGVLFLFDSLAPTRLAPWAASGSLPRAVPVSGGHQYHRCCHQPASRHGGFSPWRFL